ncbi:px domain-containing protein [Stemphylium lycopersici]|uniref:Px domain-containing protein n=1 Tax=Stemphylium lycopersici TaxID=183478 RepID=A0A364NCI5_STELY|nr:px domain-containing protein [Stemphylium lycopersici]
MTTEPSASKHKRKRSVDLDNKYDSSEFDEDDLNEALSQAETPCNTAKRADFITPTGKRRNFGLDMNQCSRVEARPLQTPRAKRIASGSPFSLKTPKTNSNMFTPSASSDGKPISNSLKNAVVEELATDVFDLLQGSGMRLDECIERDLRALLNQHAKSAEGYRRGRDASRAQVKAKDAKIAELTFRIGTLEAELQAEKTTVENLQWEAENGTSVG